MRISLPVWKKGLGLQGIHEVKLCHEGPWARKHLASLSHAYAHAPYFRDHWPFLEKIFTRPPPRLLDMNLEIIRYLMIQFRIDTRMVLLSELEIHARGDQLIIEICRKLEAPHFRAPAPAKKHIHTNLFEKSGIGISFVKIPSPIYPQLWGPFIPNLSAIDMLLNCGPKSHDLLTKS